ncbi:MAG: RDD family protein [Bacilli bacterium]|jgi:uncharacterized RDD family membrane protein YckC|nr:RDD family protein [Erysipelotrichia bacterium]
MNRAKSYHRIFANLFDLIVVASLLLLLTFRSIIALINGLVNPSSLDSLALFILSFSSGIFTFAIVLIYFVILPLFWNGQTLGKRFFKIKIMKIDGSEIDFKTIFLRESTRVLLVIMTFGFSALVDMIILIISKQGLGFYDYVSSTQVVDVV